MCNLYINSILEVIHWNYLSQTKHVVATRNEDELTSSMVEF